MSKRCEFCGRYFVPDSRVGDRQRACFRQECRSARKQSAQRRWVDAIRAYIPQLTIQFVDNKIMNQLYYAVNSKRFADEGFTTVGNLAQGITDTLNVLRTANRG